MGDFISHDLLFRWMHMVFGITWIGLLYYFNFVQGEYFKEAEASAKADAVQKLAPRALWWFRWGAMLTFLTGVVLLLGIRKTWGIDSYIIMGSLMGIIMFLNVWLVIWPAQQVVIGLKEGDKAKSGAKAGLASRTNTLFSGPMALGMLGSSHGGGTGGNILEHATNVSVAPPLGLWVVIAIIVALEINALIGKTGPMTTVKGVIHCSIALTVVCLAALQLL